MSAEPPSAEARLTAFLNWATENGIKYPKAELRYIGPEAGYGFFSIDQIRGNEVVIEVPKAVMITSALIADIPVYNAVLKKYKKALTPAEVLVLFFYIEKRNPTSFWKPYLDMLPESFSTPRYTHMSHEMPLDHLPKKVRMWYLDQCTEIADLAPKLRQIVKVFPDAAPFDRDHYLWAWHVVNTRCIYCENRCHELVNTERGARNNVDDLAVIPLMDMLNHDNEPQCQPGFDKHAQCYRVRVEKFVSEGHQLYVAYGSHDNAKLWINYGFRLPNNILNKIELPLSLILTLADAIDVKPSEKVQQILDEGDNFGCYLYANINRIPDGLLQTCRLLTMDNAQLKDYKRHLNENRDDDAKRRAEDLAKEILLKLSQHLGNRRDAAPDDLKWLWSEQVDIIEAILHPTE